MKDEVTKPNLRVKLSAIQGSLKAPKGQTNKFGGYNYRSAEDILNSVKPLLGEWGCSLVVSDEIVEVAGRVYVRASATLADNDSEQAIAQITGSASSYARKYALNGLFAIDDTKDPDALNTHGTSNKPKTKTPSLEELI